MEIFVSEPFSVPGHPEAGTMVDGLRLVEARVVGSFPHTIHLRSCWRIFTAGPYEVFGRTMPEEDV